MTANQGTELSYDDTGTINAATKYEGGALQHYTYRYNTDNQLEAIQKTALIYKQKLMIKPATLPKKTPTTT